MSVCDLIFSCYKQLRAPLASPQKPTIPTMIPYSTVIIVQSPSFQNLILLKFSGTSDKISFLHKTFASLGFCETKQSWFSSYLTDLCACFSFPSHLQELQSSALIFMKPSLVISSSSLTLNIIHMLIIPKFIFSASTFPLNLIYI